jgi:hypothetical protein
MRDFSFNSTSTYGPPTPDAGERRARRYMPMML